MPHESNGARHQGCKSSLNPRLELREIDRSHQICSNERVQANRLRVAIKNLAGALRETEAALEELRADSDPLAVHIFVARRQYRNVPDTKGGKRSEIAARLSFQTACELGYRGSLAEWERLMGAKAKR
jgi:hypothetical protein